METGCDTSKSDKSSQQESKEAKKPKKKVGCLVFIICAVVAIIFFGGKAEDKEKEILAGPPNRSSWTAKNECSRAVEAHAKYEYKWSSSLERFPSENAYFLKEDDHIIIFVGNNDKKTLSFKNGFGVMVPMRFECVYDWRNKKVARVNISER